MAGSAAAAANGEQFADAYKALRTDSAIQFTLIPPPPTPKPPDWLRAVLEWLGGALTPIGRFLKWIGSFFPDAAYARILLWGVIGAGVALLAWALFNRLRHGEWRIRAARRTMVTGFAEEEEGWAPAEYRARSWLEEADALARDGRFAEAIHHLLVRSVEDIARRRPALVRPALTSRELAASESIPGRARALFAGIARLVERSLFGARPVSEEEWAEARRAYADFALPAAWRA